MHFLCACKGGNGERDGQKPQSMIYPASVGAQKYCAYSSLPELSMMMLTGGEAALCFGENHGLSGSYRLSQRTLATITHDQRRSALVVLPILGDQCLGQGCAAI
jgi:hypothetical protein